MRSVAYTLLFSLLFAIALWFFFVRMPRPTKHGSTLAADPSRSARLRRDTMMLGSEIGERNVFEREGLVTAESWLTEALAERNEARNFKGFT